MDCIRAIGFDMDYTLARYYKERVEALAYRVAQEAVRNGRVELDGSLSPGARGRTLPAW